MYGGTRSERETSATNSFYRANVDTNVEAQWGMFPKHVNGVQAQQEVACLSLLSHQVIQGLCRLPTGFRSQIHQKTCAVCFMLSQTKKGHREKFHVFTRGHKTGWCLVPSSEWMWLRGTSPPSSAPCLVTPGRSPLFCQLLQQGPSGRSGQAHLRGRRAKPSSGRVRAVPDAQRNRCFSHR